MHVLWLQTRTLVIWCMKRFCCVRLNILLVIVSRESCFPFRTVDLRVARLDVAAGTLWSAAASLPRARTPEILETRDLDSCRSALGVTWPEGEWRQTSDTFRLDRTQSRFPSRQRESYLNFLAKIFLSSLLGTHGDRTVWWLFTN